MIPEAHPATTTLIFASLLLMCGIPLAAWLTLEKTQNPAAAKLWFGGLALNACATFLLIVAAGPAKPLIQGLAHAMSSGGALMIGDTLRRSNERPPLPAWVFAAVPGFLAAMTVISGFAGVDDGAMRAMYLLFVGFLFVWVVGETVRLYQRHRYRSLALITGMLTLVCVVNFTRSLAYFLFGMSPLLPSFTPTAAVAWVTNLSAVVLCSFGYWSFALERAHESDLDARQKMAEAKARAEQAEADSRTLTRLIEERDEMIILNSRMTGLTGASVFGAGMIHEVNQYLEALTARLGAADLLAPDQHPTLRVQVSEAIALTDTISASIRPLRDLLVAGKPKVERVEVASEVAAIVGIIDNECARHGIAFEATIDVAAREVACACDRVLLRRIIINLATNAIQELARARAEGYGGAGRIHIDVAIGQAENALRITFADNGSGFPEEMLRQPLTMLKTYKEEGVGLGLVLSDMVLRSWDGKLTLSNDNGAQVTMFIPMVTTAAMAEPARV